MKPAMLPIFVVFLCWVVQRAVSEDTRPAETLRVGERNTVPSAQLRNLLKIHEQVYCGGEPRGEQAFAELAELGIRTVVSVDAALPDVPQARRYQLRYVHIPLGYGDMDDQAAWSLARLVRDADGPYYIHCHHGRHRGPAAAAVACLAAGYLDRQAALQVLENAGTSRAYGGLWRAVREYRRPPGDAVLPALVEAAKLGSLASAMADIDRVFDNLSGCRDAGWASPSNHSDLSPQQQALLLKESFRESRRHLSAGFDRQFQLWMADAENSAQQIQDALSAGDRQAAAGAFVALADSCDRCHDRYRN